jgi:chemotaxis protein MotB
MNRQKDTTIDSLNNQLSAKDETIGTMTAELENLRKTLDQAQALLEKNLGKGLERPIIIKQALPDPLHDELKKLAEAFPEQIEYLPEKGAVRWKADLLFPLGSDQLNAASASLEALKKFAGIVQSDKAAGFEVIVVGHTCTTPIVRPETLAEHKTNWHLSAHRAISVMSLLAEQGVGMPRMGVMGYGEHRPIADNGTKEGKAKNRRVEIYLVPKESVQAVGMGIFQVEDQDLAFMRAGNPDNVGS